MIQGTENEANARRRAVRESFETVLREGPITQAVRNSSPGSFGDAGLGGTIGEDGSFTGWFKVGDGVGTAPVRPATRP